MDVHGDAMIEVLGTEFNVRSYSPTDVRVTLITGKVAVSDTCGVHSVEMVPGQSVQLSSDGTFDMYEIMKALYDIGFDGPIRPDHGRMIWGEVAMPGYGLYDRALGATYLNGLWEAIEKGETRHAVK